jgi:tripartite-type tricarboxylate transporter receptor subunit TctC
MLTRRHLGRRTASFALTGAGLALSRPALAAYPDRPITVIVPFAPGGANDLAGRLLADRIGPLLTAEGRALVENRPGGGSAIGADYVRHARPDGHTLLVVTTRQLDPNFPDVPTVAEAVLPDYELTTWTVMAGPKDMPDDIAAAQQSRQYGTRQAARPRAAGESTGTTPVLDCTPASTRAFQDHEFALHKTSCGASG